MYKINEESEIFPTFDNLDYIMFDSELNRRSYTDKDGDRKLTRVKYYDVALQHNMYRQLFNVKVELDKFGNKICFRLFDGNNKMYWYKFNYTEDGYEQLKQQIEKILGNLLNMLNTLLVAVN